MTTARRYVSCWIGIGSNLDGPKQQVGNAFIALNELRDTELREQSPLFRTMPLGPPDQPDYINAVARISTRLDADSLLDGLLSIERAAGRRRVTKWGPRILDLDILTYGSQQINRPGLQVPHPGIRHRNFVLLPLLSVAPDLDIPGLGPVHQLAADVDHEGVVRLD